MDNLDTNLNQPQEEVINIGAFLSTLWHMKFRIIFVAAWMIASGGYYVINLPKTYVASSILLLGSSSNSLNLPSVAGFTDGGDSKMDTFMEFMQSRQFIDIVIDDLSLKEVKEFQPQKEVLTGIDLADHIASEFLNKLSLSVVRETEMLKVSFESSSPQLATNVVNHFGPTFFEYQAEKDRIKATETTEWLNNQLKPLEEKLADAEEALQNYLKENQLIDVSSQIELARTELTALMGEKLESDKTLAELEATVMQIRKYRNNEQELMQIPWLLQNPLITSLRVNILEQEQALAEISKRYKYKHPRYIAVNTRLKQLRGEMTKLIARLIASLELQYETLSDRIQTLNQAIDSSKSKHSELGRHELFLTRLSREVDSTQKMYEVFLGRLQETEILKDLGNSDEFAVVDFASVPRNPAKPNVPLLLSALIVVSTFASVGLWLVVHLISDRGSRWVQILKKSGTPVLASIPRVNRADKQNKNMPLNYVEGKNFAQYTEVMRGLRTWLMIQPQAKNKRVIAITSVARGEGKSSIAISLARAFGELEKVILVEANLRNPALAKTFSLHRDHPGLTNIIANKAKFSESVHRDTVLQIDLLPSGPKPKDPLAYLSKARFSHLIKKLGMIYDHVIIEAPPIATFSDALIISKLVDGVIVVGDPEIIDTQQLFEAIQKLKETQSPIWGVVLNQIKTSSSDNSKNLLKDKRLFGTKKEDEKIFAKV